MLDWLKINKQWSWKYNICLSVATTSLILGVRHLLTAESSKPARKQVNAAAQPYSGDTRVIVVYPTQTPEQKRAEEMQQAIIKDEYYRRGGSLMQGKNYNN